MQIFITEADLGRQLGVSRQGLRKKSQRRKLIPDAIVKIGKREFRLYISKNFKSK